MSEDVQEVLHKRRQGGINLGIDLEDDDEVIESVLPVKKEWPKDLALLPKGKPKGSLNKVGIEAKRWAAKFVDDPRWEKMIWFWVENPEMMPAGVFTTIMFYKFGKPPQTVKVKGEIMARPYLGETPAELAARAQQLATRLARLNDPVANAKALVEDTEE